MKAMRRLFGHYTAYHEHGPLMLRYLSLLGFVGWPLFYLLRFTKNAPVYDDLAIRVLDAVICIVLFVRDRWPERLKRYAYPYSYFVLIVTLPFTLVFLSLKNGGGAAGVANTLFGAFLVILLADWRNMIVILVSGIALAVGVYVGFDPQPRWPAEYVERLPLLVLTVVGGSLFKFALERATAEKVRAAYAALAGSIAHEMRNPLGQLRHSLEGMRHSLDAGETHGAYQHLEQGETAVNRGLQVISMTLDEVNAKPLDPAGFELISAAAACRKAVQEYGYDDVEERMRVRVDVVQDFTFRGDETAFLFVVFNLMKNSLYYAAGRDGLRVVITVDTDRVVVRDNGPGIAPEALPRLFEPFRSSGKTGGTGLGLSYCRRVMNAFGGSVSCTSLLGHFTEFSLGFPPVEPEALRAWEQGVLQIARAQLAGKRLLIVEDDAAQRSTTRHKLRPLALEIDEAADGQRALELLWRNDYDLVLMDLKMPVLDGYEVARRVREGRVPRNLEVAIIAYSSEPAQFAAGKAQEAGMDAFLAKPSGQIPLLQALLAALRHSQRARDKSTLLAGRRILLADDSAFNRKAVAAYLRSAGAAVAEAEHGEAVLDELRSRGRCDAVLMDIQMPAMGGLEAVQRIRESGEPWADVPVIALSAHSDPAILKTAETAGMNGFLVKPVDAGLLYETLGPLLAPAAGQAPRHPPLVAAARPETGGLLNIARLESYRRLGMLDELMEDYLPEIGKLVQRLEQAVLRNDLEASVAAMHSLLGMSGEAGGQALHQLVHELYVPMLEEHRWPEMQNWLQRVKQLVDLTGAALRDYAAAERPAGVN